MPIPNSAPQSHETTEHACYFLNAWLGQLTPHSVQTGGGPTMDVRSLYDRARQGRAGGAGARSKQGAQKVGHPDPADVR